ncbi:MAG TPA: hypothetical protein VGE74_05615 [Gemmata sp.]
MIRFNCPHCNRYYELHPALAHLPLVCKQCGQHFTPPEGQPNPAPIPPAATSGLPIAEVVAPPPAMGTKPPAKAPKPKPPAQRPPAAPPKPPAPPPDDDEDDGVLVTKPDASPDIDFNVGGPTAASLSDASRAKPAGLSDASRPRPREPDTDTEINLDLLPPPPAPRRVPKRPAPEPQEETRSEPTLVPFLADLAVFVVLIVVGMLFGEMLAQKPTGAVLSGAGSAPKFPPVELVLWGAPPALLALVYLLLNSRQRTLGAWLRRRAAR